MAQHQQEIEVQPPRRYLLNFGLAGLIFIILLPFTPLHEALPVAGVIFAAGWWFSGRYLK